MRSQFSFSISFLLGTVLLVCAPFAQAQATRTWVSGVGDDANPCSRTAPCRTFAGAISKTAAGGTIDALDSGSFGAVNITKSLTINGTSTSAGVLSPGTNGIVVNGADIHVVLRELAIEGSGTGINGIQILNAASVLVERVTIEGIASAAPNGNAINIAPAVSVDADVKVTVRDVTITDVEGAAISLSHQAPGRFALLTARDVRINKVGKGIAAGTRSRAQVEGVLVNSASDAAFLADGSSESAEIAAVASTSANGGSGVRATGPGARVTLSGCTLSGNAIGIEVSGGGAVASFGDNRILDNGENGQPTEELGNQ